MEHYFSNSSASTPIGVKKRADIIRRRVSYQGDPYWVCKDPLAQEYFYLNEQEYAILGWLDGHTSFDQLKDRFEHDFSPYRVTYRELTQLIGSFHERSLVKATAAGQGQKLLEMGREKERKKLKEKLSNVCTIKWKGFDPEIFLNATNPYVTPFFSQRAVAVVLAMVCFAALWLIVHLDQVMARVPSLWSFVDSSNWSTLGLVIVASKLLHELGHAYAFKRFGGEVHEIGIMIFFFMPTMYCNTTDSWMLENKWSRMAVALGGIYVELFIFSVATFFWWGAEPGIIQDLSINLMFVCSLSTVLINGNPLLKYDGYFVLADLVEIPNLDKQSSSQIMRKFLGYGLGIEGEEALWISRSNQRFMLAYAVGAYLFRLSLMLSVAYFLVLQAAPFGLSNIAFLFSIVVTVVYLSMPFYKLGKRVLRPGTFIKIKRSNLLTTFGIASFLFALFFIPFPYYLDTDCTMDGGVSVKVVTHEDGWLAETFSRVGEEVSQGDLMAQLENPQLEKLRMRVETDLAIKRSEIEDSRLDLFETGVETKLRSLVKEAANLEDSLGQLTRRCESLSVRAPHSGMVIGITPRKENEMLDDERELTSDHGNLLTSNDRTWLQRGCELCRICATGDTWVTLTISQNNQDLIAPGQKVLLKFNTQRATTFHSTISVISAEAEPIGDIGEFESQGTRFQAIAEESQNRRQGPPVNKDGASMESGLFLARCRLDEDSHVLFGSSGMAKVCVGNRSLYWRVRRSVNHFMTSKL